MIWTGENPPPEDEAAYYWGGGEALHLQKPEIPAEKDEKWGAWQEMQMRWFSEMMDDRKK